MISIKDFEEYIEQAGIETALQKIKLQEDQVIRIQGENGEHISKGPGYLFVGYYPEIGDSSD